MLHLLRMSTSMLFCPTRLLDVVRGYDVPGELRILLVPCETAFPHCILEISCVIIVAHTHTPTTTSHAIILYYVLPPPPNHLPAIEHSPYYLRRR